MFAHRGGRLKVAANYEGLIKEAGLYKSEKKP